jgi:hypothetical protein
MVKFIFESMTANFPPQLYRDSTGSLDLFDPNALKHPLNKSVESYLLTIKHLNILCGKKYLVLRILDSLQQDHLPVIILLEIRLTSFTGGIGAFRHISRRRASILSKRFGSTTRSGESSLLLWRMAVSAAYSYCWPIILNLKYFPRTVEQSKASSPSR